MQTADLLENLPGEDLIRIGLADLTEGRLTVPACLAAIARPRLTFAGLWPQSLTPSDREHEVELYRLLRQEGGDAYSKYNSLLRQLISFEFALDRRLASKRLKRM